MAKVTVIYLSVNPSFYDVQKLAKLSFDEAKKFIEDDTIVACSHKVVELDMTKFADYNYCADGADLGDWTDSLLMWIRVSGD